MRSHIYTPTNWKLNSIADRCCTNMWHSFSLFSILLLQYNITCLVLLTPNKTETKLNQSKQNDKHEKWAHQKAQSVCDKQHRHILFSRILPRAQKVQAATREMLTADTATSSHLAGRFFGSPASCPAASTSMRDDAASHEQNPQVKRDAQRKRQ